MIWNRNLGLYSAWSLAVLCLGWNTPLYAQGLSDTPLVDSFDEYAPIENIEGMVTEISLLGLDHIDMFAVNSVLSVAIGQQYNAVLVRKSIENLYAKGYFEDIRVEASVNILNQGIHLIFHFVEKPAIKSVTIEGNKKIEKDSLMEAVDIEVADILNYAEIQKNVQRLRDKYIEKGYYLVEIKPVVKKISTDSVDLVFDITENRKVVVSHIDFTGNEHIRSSKMRRYLQTRQVGILPFMGGNFNETTLDADGQILRSVLMEEGFVDAKVSPPHTFLSLDKKYITVSFDIEEGVQYKIGKVNVRGDMVPEEGLTSLGIRQIINGDTAKDISDRWKKVQSDAQRNPEKPLPEEWEKSTFGALDFRASHPALETGDTFKLSVLQTTMQEITKLYGDQGYAFVNVVPVTDTDPESGVVDITFDIQKGRKMKIGRIDISGNDPTFDKVVRREIMLNEGDLYSGTGIDDARMRLQRLGFFEKVDITTPRSKEATDELNMKVEVSEQPTGSFSVGAGFSNLENFVFTANISKNNFMGLGYIMALSANISGVRQQGNLQLYDPYFLDSRWTLGINGYSMSQQFIEDEYQRGGNLAVGRYLDKRDDWRLEFNYTFADTGLNSIDPYKANILGGQIYRNGLTSSGGISLLVDKRNNRINATKGVYAVASSKLSGGFRVNDQEVLSIFGGNFNFLENKFNVRVYYPLVESQRLIFRYNGTVGMITSTDGSILPYIHRYRAGGMQSIRGYGWYTLGPSLRAAGYRSSSQSAFSGSDDPKAADDQLVVGGTQTWINNVEVEIPIVPAAGIRAVVFFDAGNAFGDPWGNGTINLADMRMAYGTGIRWMSPMGPLRFEWGFPINPYPDERKMVFDFAMGSLF